MQSNVDGPSVYKINTHRKMLGKTHTMLLIDRILQVISMIVHFLLFSCILQWHLLANNTLFNGDLEFTQRFHTHDSI